MKISQFNKNVNGFIKWWKYAWIVIFVFLGAVIIGLQLIHILDSKTELFIKEKIVEVPVWHDKPQPLCELDIALNEWDASKYKAFIFFTDNYGEESRYTLKYETIVMVDGTEIEAEIDRDFKTLNNLTMFIQSKVEENKLLKKNGI